MNHFLFSYTSRWIVVLAMATLTTAVQARDTISIDTSVGGGQVGGFYGPYLPSDDPPAGYPGSLLPDNSPTFQNYFMGRTTASPLSTGMTTPERRVFFAFDMAGLAIPVGHDISGITIELDLLPGGTSALANFTGDVELVDFTSTPYTFPEILDPGLTESEWIDIWDTFGSSSPYGGLELIGPSHPTEAPSIPGKYVVPLPGAIGDATSAIMAGDVLIVTAKLATFDPDPIGAGAPPAVDPYEYVFGLTDVFAGGSPGIAAPELTITTAAAIPEPSSIAFLVVVSLAATFRRHNRRAN